MMKMMLFNVNLCDCLALAFHISVNQKVEDWVWAVWDNSEPDREDSAAEVILDNIFNYSTISFVQVDDTEDESDESAEDSEEDIVEGEEEYDDDDEEEVLDEEMEAV